MVTSSPLLNRVVPLRFATVLIGVCLFAILAAETTVAEGPAEDEIRQLESQLSQAIVAGDASFFDRVFADDFTHGSQSGKFRTKEEWMRGKEQGKSAYVSFDSEDLQVRRFGDTALVTGLAKPHWREAGGIASGQFRFLRVWGKRGGRWQVVAFQSTGVPSDSTQPTPEQALDMDDPPPTREFSIQDDRSYLGGYPVEIWGLRCGNALYSQGVTERHVRNLDNMVAHGINCLGIYVQGSNGGHPDAEIGRNGYTSEGQLKPDFARRLEWLARRQQVEGQLALGATRWEAAREPVRHALRMGMIPIINAMAVAGVVSLPGMMTGQLLSGASPIIAVKYQIVILMLVASATLFGTAGVILLSYFRLFSRDHQFLYQRLTESE